MEARSVEADSVEAGSVEAGSVEVGSVEVPPPPSPRVVDRTNPISFVLLGTLFGNNAVRNIQDLVFTNLNFADIQMLRLAAGDVNRPDIVDRIFNHTPHPSTITPADGLCQVLVGDQLCGNGAHNNYYNRYCRLHGDVGPGPRPIAGAVLFSICHEHRYNEDRRDEIEEFYIHALCGPCQTIANMKPGDSDCVCEARLRDWCCRSCVRTQIDQWQVLADSTERGMTEREHVSYEVGNAFNRKRLCPVCRARQYLGPRRVGGEVVPQVRWCPICRNLRRDADVQDYGAPPQGEDSDHDETVIAEEGDEEDDDEEDEVEVEGEEEEIRARVLSDYGLHV